MVAGAPEDERSIRLGLNFLHFQYHLLMVCLTHTVKTSESICLASARVCLNMLDTLVSNANEVYNGIVWLVGHVF
jgi:hypothetical protein